MRRFVEAEFVGLAVRGAAAGFRAAVAAAAGMIPEWGRAAAGNTPSDVVVGAAAALRCMDEGERRVSLLNLLKGGFNIAEAIRLSKESVSLAVLRMFRAAACLSEGAVDKAKSSLASALALVGVDSGFVPSDVPKRTIWAAVALALAAALFLSGSARAEHGTVSDVSAVFGGCAVLASSDSFDGVRADLESAAFFVSFGDADGWLRDGGAYPPAFSAHGAVERFGTLFDEFCPRDEARAAKRALGSPSVPDGEEAAYAERNGYDGADILRAAERYPVVDVIRARFGLSPVREVFGRKDAFAVFRALG